MLVKMFIEFDFLLRVSLNHRCSYANEGRPYWSHRISSAVLLITSSMISWVAPELTENIFKGSSNPVKCFHFVFTLYSPKVKPSRWSFRYNKQRFIVSTRPINKSKCIHGEIWLNWTHFSWHSWTVVTIYGAAV